MDLLVAIDTLDDLVHNARAVPMTDQVRLPRGSLEAATEQLRAALPAAGLGANPEAEELLGRLEGVARSAKRVMLTKDVRVDKDELYEILDRLRALAGA
ncbi:MAG TPA: hypothetical protein VF587_06400 [Solirubrobacteraceae bacterium]|jgi:hypothetical protein